MEIEANAKLEYEDIKKALSNRDLLAALPFVPAWNVINVSDEPYPEDSLIEYTQSKYRQILRGCVDYRDRKIPGTEHSLAELLIRSITYLVLRFGNGDVAANVPSEVFTSKDAKNILAFFKHVLLDSYIDAESKIESIQMYITEIYQYQDLWDPPEGKYHKALTSEENSLLDFLACGRIYKLHGFSLDWRQDDADPVRISSVVYEQVQDSFVIKGAKKRQLISIVQQA